MFSNSCFVSPDTGKRLLAALLPLTPFLLKLSTTDGEGDLSHSTPEKGLKEEQTRQAVSTLFSISGTIFLTKVDISYVRLGQPM